MIYLHPVLGDEVGHESSYVAVGDLVVSAARLGLDLCDGPAGVAELHDRDPGVVEDPDRLRREQRVLPARGVKPHPYVASQPRPGGLVSDFHKPGRSHRACSTARRTRKTAPTARLPGFLA